MKTIILCGGIGARLKEETEFKPKPMISIGDVPMLWHIMKHYAHFGHNQFVLTLGYKGHMIKDYFTTHNPDRFEMIFADTGENSLTGARILRAAAHITEDEFMVTYGDGVSTIDLDELVKFHRKQNTIGTISGVHPSSKYGVLTIDANKNLVVNFEEKKPILQDYVSGGYMIFRKEALKYFDESEFENGLIRLAKAGELSVHLHEGFWKPMDTYREMEELNALWRKEKKWAIWEKSEKTKTEKKTERKTAKKVKKKIKQKIKK